MFNFPEVEYGLAPTPTSSLYSNHNFDFNHQLPKVISTPSKYSVPSTNDPESHKHKKNRKNSAIEGKTEKKLTTLPKSASVPNTCFNNELFFPSVDYPLDVTDLWTPHYWNRIPQMQTEPKLDIIDLTINTNPKKEKTKVAKGSRKKTKVNKIFNSCLETKTNVKAESLPILNTPNVTKPKQNLTDCVDHNKNLSRFAEILPNKETFIPTSAIEESKQCTTESFPIKKESENLQDKITFSTESDILPQTPSEEFKSPTSSVSRDQKAKDTIEQATIGQVTPTPNVEIPYCTESQSTTSNLISFLTTVTPTLRDSNENPLENLVLSNNQTRILENLCNSTEIENEYEDSQLPDDMGYTIMYPEQYGSVSTSTMSPLDEDIIDNVWMYPELDNHTFNSYSDEVEQCYILVP
ncbi:hypothetical protein RR48_10942 [Papilio machaon]|uniref:Uncharacterized protein n=1 Tax=Papilio machaon TaxID=76193 RepID=A0A194R7F3_PAPMA|nr:hypothetical protein RR48_10942 [Papilio machaon]